MDRFEAYLIPGGDVEIRLLDKGEIFLLDSEKGLSFAGDLHAYLSRFYPSMLRAVEQKIKQANRSLYATILKNRRLYLQHTAHIVCSCCFGECDEAPDFDGRRFRMEFPRQCREQKFCPWCGYSARNKDSFMVICGAKREFGLTPQERCMVLLVQGGITDSSMLADAMQLSQKRITNMLSSVYKKIGVSGMPELLTVLKDERI